jgi:xylan 1,4-beta-xylosidase
MFGMMKGKLVQAESNRRYPLQEVLDSSIRRTTTDIGALASKDKKSAAVMLWNYHDADVKGDTGKIAFFVAGIPAKKVKLTHYRIDDAHSNSYEVWKKMGSPQNPTAAQITELEKAGQLAQLEATQTVTVINGVLQMSIALPRQAVSLLKMDW